MDTGDRFERGTGYYSSESARRASRRQGWAVATSITIHALLFLFLVHPKLRADPQKEHEKDHRPIFIPIVAPPPKQEAKQTKPKVAAVIRVGNIEPLEVKPIPIDRSLVNVPVDVKYSIDDPMDLLPQVLARTGGCIGFEDPDEKGFVARLFRAEDWTEVVLPNGMVSRQQFSSYQPDKTYSKIEELRAKHHIPGKDAAFVLFPLEFNIVVVKRIWEFAADHNKPGKVESAVLRFSSTDQVGIEVQSVQIAGSSP